MTCTQPVKPAWPSGKELGWYAKGPWFDFTSAFLSLQKLRFVDTVVVTLLLTINETFKMALVAAYLNALRSHPGGDSVALGIVSLFPHLLGSRSSPVPLRRPTKPTQPTRFLQKGFSPR